MLTSNPARCINCVFKSSKAAKYMPANNKFYVHDSLIDVTFRTEEGLPLPPNDIMRTIICSVMARAQSMYPIIISHFLVMSNHLHMLLVVVGPQDVPSFIEYFKRETAHAINRLQGRTKKTVWSDYSAPTILDGAKAMDRIVYILSNPQKANLVEKIEDYPNLSSFQAMSSGREDITTKHKRINRNDIMPLPKASLSLPRIREIAQSLANDDAEEFELTIKPNAWMSCFPELEGTSASELNREILKRIRQEETQFAKKREQPPMGAHALILEPMTKPHIPEQHGMKMICLGTEKSARKRFIEFFRELVAAKPKLIRNVTEMPPGLFAAGGRLWANLLPQIVPIPRYCWSQS